MKLAAPFPWFGGKSRAAHLIWPRFGDVPNYVEPFFGSGAVLLARPDGWRGSETVNDKDGFVANFWRALQHDPQAVADHADWPVNENDQHARHVWLVAQRETLTAKLEGDPEFYDVKIAGWWVWGICCWIGSGWCSGDGPWRVDDAGKLVHLGTAGQGVHRKLVHLGTAGRGVHRKLVHLGTAGQGVHRQLVHLGDAGQGEWFAALAERLRRVRVCCGDWARVLGPTPTVKLGTTAVLLDPPYADSADRTSDLYAEDSESVAHDVREWAVANGDNPELRIALCGYAGEHALPDGWQRVEWKARGGYGSQGDGRGRANAERETIWFSPHCLRIDHARQTALFSDEATA
jgi:DNA adenine methylase